MEFEPCIFTFKHLKRVTDNFSADKLIGSFQHGQLYRGVIHGKNVIVKKWMVGKFHHYPSYQEGDFTRLFKHDIKMFQHIKIICPQIMVDVIGYCDEGEERLATVLDLHALDSLYNLVVKDELSWLQRMKVMIGFGFFVEAMHENTIGKHPYLLRNFDTKHIVLDEDYNPKLVDLQMVTVGEFPSRDTVVTYHGRSVWYRGIRGSDSYWDPAVLKDGWSEKVDVFTFGILITVLIGQEKYLDDNYVEPEKFRAGKQGYVRPRSIYPVNRRFAKGQVGYYHSDGIALTELAVSCLQRRHFPRPTMKVIVEALKNLSVFRHFQYLLEPSSKTPL